MRRAAAIALAAGTGCLGLGAGACFDVLHETGDLRTACERDASVEGCGSTDAPPGLCAPSASEARRTAAHACAWLGACETPMGRNAFGDCMFEALLAYDCDANPAHPAGGSRAGLWRCLARARTCDDVDACIFPAGLEPCGSPGRYIGCGNAGPPGKPSDRDVRVECNDGDAGPFPRSRGESCALWGQTCNAASSAVACAPSAAAGCTQSECAGSVIHWCSGETDVGLDCASFGSPRCAAFPATAPTWVACVPPGDAGASCTPDTEARCADGVARSCPAGVPETVNCAALLGAPAEAGACREGPLVPPFDWTSACVLDPPACTADACDGGLLTGCARGAAFSVDCAEAGLGACSMRSTDLGTRQHAACTPP
jgi:hypothetical protein